jgi:hypothetical protein
MCGGPVCTYLGKKIPCFVGCSPKACITSTMLAAMLEIIDSHEVFDRSEGTPVLLLDGHHSRLKIPFLSYINDDKHKWTVCLGVPYGTHLWQVADAPELNGTFKIALWKEKRKYLREKRLAGMNNFSPTDIIPLVNTAWDKSFARVPTARKAIQKRGWYPLNYRLLDDPNLIQLPSGATDTNIEDPATETNAEKAATDQQQDNNTLFTFAGTSSTSTRSISVRRDGPNYTTYMDALMEDETNGLGRKRKYEERKQQQQERGRQFDSLNNVASLTSGQLAINDVWFLGPNVLGKVREKEDADNEKKRASEIKKAQQQEKEEGKFRQAYQKYVRNERLVADDLKVLLRKVKERDDSPLRSKIAELQQQWNKRKVRLDLFASTPQSDFDENNANLRTNVPMQMGHI